MGAGYCMTEWERKPVPGRDQRTRKCLWHVRIQRHWFTCSVAKVVTSVGSVLKIRFQGRNGENLKSFGCSSTFRTLCDVLLALSSGVRGPVHVWDGSLYWKTDKITRNAASRRPRKRSWTYHQRMCGWWCVRCSRASPRPQQQWPRWVTRSHHREGSQSPVHLGLTIVGIHHFKLSSVQLSKPCVWGTVLSAGMQKRIWPSPQSWAKQRNRAKKTGSSIQQNKTLVYSLITLLKFFLACFSYIWTAPFTYSPSTCGTTFLAGPFSVTFVSSLISLPQRYCWLSVITLHTLPGDLISTIGLNSNTCTMMPNIRCISTHLPTGNLHWDIP